MLQWTRIELFLWYGISISRQKNVVCKNKTNKKRENIAMSSNKQTPLKEILKFHEDTLGMDDGEKELIAKERQINFEEYKSRIVGKEKEMEFYIIMKALRIVKNIWFIDEEESQKTGEKTPDYEIEFTDGYKVMLEVKHTSKNKYKISKKNLDERIKYAQSKELDLRFAISIKGRWYLLPSSYLKEKNGKVSNEDYVKSWLDKEFATCSYMFTRPFKIVSVYSKNKKRLGIQFPPYGELISYKLYYDNKLILDIENKENKEYIFIFLLEALHDILANAPQEIVSEGEETTIIESTKDITNIFIPEYNFILSVIRHFIYSGENNSAINNKDNIFVAAKLEHIENIPYVEYFRMLMDRLNDLGVDIMCFRATEVYNFATYKEKFWTKKIDDLK